MSTDFESDPLSSIFDTGAGIMLHPTFVKLVAWYGEYKAAVVNAPRLSNAR